MPRKKVWTAEEEAELIRIQKTTGVNRKTAVRKMRAAAKVKSRPQVNAKKKTVKTKASSQKPKTSAVASRAEGVRLYNLAGRPTLGTDHPYIWRTWPQNDLGRAGQGRSLREAVSSCACR